MSHQPLLALVHPLHLVPRGVCESVLPAPSCACSPASSRLSESAAGLGCEPLFELSEACSWIRGKGGGGGDEEEGGKMKNKFINQRSEGCPMEGGVCFQSCLSPRQRGALVSPLRLQHQQAGDATSQNLPGR